METMRKKENSTCWSVPVTRTLDDALEQAVRIDTHSTKSDFIRDAVRRRLEEMGFKPRPFEDVQEAKAVE
jgi:Arc/MetJ-type ribon-helix-helix transcriptional regulator